MTGRNRNDCSNVFLDYPDISSQERTAAIERWDMRCLRGDAGEALDIFVEVETAIEAPIIAGEITLGVLRSNERQVPAIALLMLPRPVFVHLKRSSFGRPLPVTTALCLSPASASPPKQPRPSLTTRAPGEMLASARP